MKRNGSLLENRLATNAGLNLVINYKQIKMEKKNEKIKEHVKKYNRIYLCYFLAYIVVVSLSLMLDVPMLLIPLLALVIIHILTRCVDVAEIDYLMNEQLFDDLKDRHP